MNIGFSALGHACRIYLHIPLSGFTVTQTLACIPVKPTKMGSSGLEPPTSRLSGARSNLLSYEPASGTVPPPYLHLLWSSRKGFSPSFALGYPWFSPFQSAWDRFGIAALPYFTICACPVKAIGFPFHFRDGDDGIRTHDPLLAGQVLSQLSYTPMLVTHRPLLFFFFYNELLNESIHTTAACALPTVLRPRLPVMHARLTQN